MTLEQRTADITCALIRSVSLIKVEAAYTRGIYDLIKSSWSCNQVLMWMVEKHINAG